MLTDLTTSLSRVRMNEILKVDRKEKRVSLAKQGVPNKRTAD